MSCPTCDHTMQTLFVDRERSIYWCPRCGTLRSVLFEHEDDSVPFLISRCREFQRNHLAEATINSHDYRAWRRLGIEESINVPDERPFP